MFSKLQKLSICVNKVFELVRKVVEIQDHNEKERFFRGDQDIIKFVEITQQLHHYIVQTVKKDFDLSSFTKNGEEDLYHVLSDPGNHRDILRDYIPNFVKIFNTNQTRLSLTGVLLVNGMPLSQVHEIWNCLQQYKDSFNHTKKESNHVHSKAATKNKRIRKQARK